MSALVNLFACIAIFTIVEIFSPAYVLLCTTFFVFLLVSNTVCLSRSSLISLLVFVIQAIIGIYFSTCSLLVFFISFEFSLLPITLLVLLFGYQPEKIQSSL